MKERMNPAVTGIAMSGIRAYSAMAKATPGCVALTIGEPDFNTPDAVKERAKQDLDANLTHYPEGNGEPYLREAIAKFEQEKNGYDYTPDEVIVTAGATGALFCALCGILAPGDEVVVPTPAFGLYETIIAISRGVYVPMPTQGDHFQITAERLRAVITEKTKAIILTSPNNPTGCVYSEESLQAVRAAAKEHDLFVLCDDVYAQLSYTENYHSFASYRDLRDRIILIQSFSKPYAMTGWRVGYLCADAPVRAELQKVNQNCIVSINAFVQHACVTALGCDVTEMRETYRRRRDFILGRLAEMGMEVEKPEGAFYVFPSIAKYGMSSEEFCTRMIKEGGVGAVPGVFFSAEGYIRLSYCYSDEELRTAMDKMEAFLKTL